MAEILEPVAIERWQRDPASFIEQVCRDPATGKPFVLLDAEREFLGQAFRTDESGKLVYPEQVFSGPKKIGKSAFGALMVLTSTLIYGGRFAEGYCVANDLEQAQGRVFQATRRIVEASPLLRREAKITANKIEFAETGATISAIASDYAGAAGGNPTVTCFDELWAYRWERSRRLWDEMVPPPTRKIGLRLTVTYAGFSGESVLLEEIYKRGKAQPVIGKDMHAGDGLLFFWTHDPIAPWQDAAWLAQMKRTLRKNQYLRMIENRWVTSESEFIPMVDWDACVAPGVVPVFLDQNLPVWIGVDASVKRDSTAIAAVAFDGHKARLVAHRIFQPSITEPLDFELTVERTLLDLHKRFRVRGILYDPYQMASSAQRLAAAGLPMQEYPQTVGNLTDMGTTLYDLIRSRSIEVYDDAQIRRAVAQAVAVEGARGWKISKDKQSHRIDIVIALAMACLGAVKALGRSGDSSAAVWDWAGDGAVHPVGADGRTVAEKISALSHLKNGMWPSRTNADGSRGEPQRGGSSALFY